jgi:acetolactate synthase-1/2/3 large subunit
MRVSEYISQTLADFGVRHVFMLTGGGSMFLNYDIGTNPQIQVIFNHHEQACAMAAEGYARITNTPGVINVTTGPGGVNALNGVYGAFTDSIPMLILSGQVKRETYLRMYDLPDLRQLGDQEIDIVSMVKNITKYAVTVTNSSEIRYELEKAWHLAQTGRRGPVWLDIPIDVQSSQVDPDTLRKYKPNTVNSLISTDNLSHQVSETLTRIKSSQRPVILAGTGVRLSGAVEIFNEVIHKLGIPVTTGWTHDLIDSDDPFFCGRPGTIGTRPGNFTVQNSDVLLVLGSRLNIRQTGYAFKSFARASHKIWVDIDPAELSRPTIQPETPIIADLKLFLQEMNLQLDKIQWDKIQFSNWLEWCKTRTQKYPAVLEHHRKYNGTINPYHFIDVLSNVLNKEDVVICGNGAATVITFQAFRIKFGQRLWANSGSASMGYDLPAAIGAATARNGERVVCLAGDGSIQMNIQELQTLVQTRLPVKIFVLNNNGYLSIRSSQKNFFGKSIGDSPESGVSFPNMVNIAKAYGIPTFKINMEDFAPTIQRVLETTGPVLCDVFLDPAQGFEPRQSSRQQSDGRIVSAPLEDMFPFLDHDELLTNLLIPEWKE